MEESIAVRGRPKGVYPPKWLAKYARKQKMEPLDAFIHAIENTPSKAAAARLLGISTSTFYKRCDEWGVRIDR